MLIIIEGADCTGKTTLARQLMQHINNYENTLSFRKGPPTFKNAIKEYLWPLAGYTPGNKQHIICDRWHIGEMIYPALLKRESIMRYDLDDYDIVQNTLMRLGGVIVYLDPPLSVVHKRFNERGDEMINDIDVLTESYFSFRTFMNNRFDFDFALETIRFSNMTDIEKVLKVITQNADTHERMCA